MPCEEHDYNQISKLLPKSKPKGITGVRSKRVSVETKSRTCTVVGCRHTHTRTREAMLAIDRVGGAAQVDPRRDTVSIAGDGARGDHKFVE